MSADRTDVPIQEITPFSLRWYSHNLHRADLSNEVGVSIYSGQIASVNGSCRLEVFKGLGAFCRNIHEFLTNNGSICADDGYGNQNCLRRSHLKEPHKSYNFGIVSRLKKVNGILKRFLGLRQRFRQDFLEYKTCILAAACLCALIIFHEQPLLEL